MTELKKRGLVPIVAHPERYPCFRRNYNDLCLLMQEGVLFQVNVDSLCGWNGRSEYRFARKMVNRNDAAFLATDSHGVNFRPNNLLEQLLGLPKKVHADRIDDMLNRNPELVLQDREIWYPAPGQSETQSGYRRREKASELRQ